jgi:hypothetical protein
VLSDAPNDGAYSSSSGNNTTSWQEQQQQHQSTLLVWWKHQQQENIAEPSVLQLPNTLWASNMAMAGLAVRDDDGTCSSTSSKWSWPEAEQQQVDTP